MKRLYSILIVVITLLFVAFIIQNAEMVKLTFLVWGLEISKALLMMICAAVGFLIGLLAFSFRKSHTEPEQLKSPSKQDDATSSKPS